MDASMTGLAPLPALRYAPTFDLAAVTCPPYDVISDAQRAELEKLHPTNYVRLVRSSEPDPYSSASRLLDSWISEQVLVPSMRACVWLYAMQTGDDVCCGLIGALSLDSEILPHENTTPKPKADRLELMRATGANLEPIWVLTTSPIEGFAEFAAGVMEAKPEMTMTDADGTVHCAWPVFTADGRSIIDKLAGVTCFIADGHHRFETARSYRSEFNAPGPWDRVLAFVGDRDAYSPKIRAIHRIATGLDAQEFIQRHASERGPVKILYGDSTYQLDTGGLGASEWCHKALEEAGASVAYEPDEQAVRKVVKEGALGLLLQPISVGEVAKVARQGERLPPKTTLFWPKPRSGFLLRIWGSRTPTRGGP